MRRSPGKEFIVNTRTCAHVPISFCKRDVNPYPSVLTRWGRLMHICVTNLGHHWFRWWLVAWSAPSHCLNQCCVIVNLTLGNKLGSKQSNCVQNLNIFIQDNAFENVLWKMAAICFGCNVLVHRQLIHKQLCRKTGWVLLWQISWWKWEKHNLTYSSRYILDQDGGRRCCGIKPSTTHSHDEGQKYRQTSSISRTKSLNLNLNVSRPVLQLSLCYLLTPGFESIMKT